MPAEVVHEAAVQAWLQSNALTCPRLRASLTPAQCRALRRRPDNPGIEGALTRPWPCRGCKGVEALAAAGTEAEGDVGRAVVPARRRGRICVVCGGSFKQSDKHCRGAHQGCYLRWYGLKPRPEWEQWLADLEAERAQGVEGEAVYRPGVRPELCLGHLCGQRLRLTYAAGLRYGLQRFRWVALELLRRAAAGPVLGLTFREHATPEEVEALGLTGIVVTGRQRVCYVRAELRALVGREPLSGLLEPGRGAGRLVLRCGVRA